MQKIVDYLSWGFILLFAVPTILIMASWNSLPGEPMFGVKRSFEEVLLFFVKPSYAAEAQLNMHYTRRRMNEAKTLLANRKSTEGLSYLSQQVRMTKAVIERAPSKEKQREVAQSYIQTLRAVSSELETQQREIVSESSGVPPQSLPTSRPTSTPQPTNVQAHLSIPTQQPTRTPTQAPHPTTQPPMTPGTQPLQSTEAVGQLQEEIQETIQELESLAGSDDDDDGSENNNHGQGQGIGRGQNERGQGQGGRQGGQGGANPGSD
jgi:hypothetical protein